MGKHYLHLNKTERLLIKDWLDYGCPIREIGRRLKRSHSTISREIKRNLWCQKHYYFAQAQRSYEQRLKIRAQRYRLKSATIRDYVHQQLAIGWTPEIIAGRLKRDNVIGSVCHESIYQYIYLEAPELIQFLPRHHKKRWTKFPYRKKAQRIKNRVPIADRPDDIESRETFGHWESDSVVGGDRKSGLNVIVERATRFVNISLMANKTSLQTQKSIISRLKNYPKSVLKSITYDNGSENVRHEQVNKKLGTCSYFCEPYHSWEKGSVEQVNGLIRRYLPKGTHFCDIHPQEIRRIENLINNRPRKCLNYQTPSEVFKRACGAL